MGKQRKSLTFQRLNDECSSPFPVFVRNGGNETLYGALFCIEFVKYFGSFKVEIHIKMLIYINEGISLYRDTMHEGSYKATFFLTRVPIKI